MSSQTNDSAFLTSTDSVSLANTKESSGWTLEAIDKYNSLNTFEARVKLIKNIFGISDLYYNFDPASTFKVDFHAGNAAFCLDSHFTSEQTLFICQSLEILLNDAISSNTQDVNIDLLRNELGKKFKSLFNQTNVPKFNLEQIESILSFTISSFLQPIRLILLQFQPDQYCYQSYEVKKVFQPPPPIPLSEFEEQIELSPHEFPVAYLSNDINRIMSDFDKYKAEMEKVADQRLSEIDEKIKMLSMRLEDA